MDRPEVVLQEMARARLNENAVSVERVHFYKTDKGVNAKQEDPWRVFPGSLPILVSAPHAVRHVRQKKIKMSDQFTGAYVYLLNQLTECYGIAVNKLYGGDPNVDDPCIYKTRIAEICAKYRVKLVLDIHGAAREHPFDVDLGTNRGRNLLGKDKILETLDYNFQAFGLSKVSHDHFAASGPNTVANFVAREVGLPAVQIEINKHYRVPAQNPQGFHRMLGALSACIKELSN